MAREGNVATILITGASGLIGRALATSLGGNHRVLGLSRHDPGLGDSWIRGDFASVDDFRMLDGIAVDALAHLGAVTGGCVESACMMVNVEGTRRLMRALIERGCRKFVLASSVAAVGLQRIDFRPLALPIPDEHPCLDRDGYGVSKYLMEEVARYLWRGTPEIDVCALRLSSVRPEQDLPEKRDTKTPLGEWSLAGLTIMRLSEAVRAFSLAVESALVPGVRVMNTTPRLAYVAEPVANVLRSWWADSVDLSWFDAPERAFASVFDVSRIEAEIGFVSDG